MKKVVIFTEGQGEQILIRQILWHLIGDQNISFECLELYGDNLRAVPFDYKSANPLIHYQIINVGNDERVSSAIKDRYDGYVSAGYEIVGVRDMCSSAYKKRSMEINLEVNNYFIQSYNEILQLGTTPVHFFFAVMELEAWILAMHKVLTRIDTQLTSEYIAEQLGYDLCVIDPETSFFSPANELAEIFTLAGKKYDKHRGDMENIAHNIFDEDILNVLEDKRFNSFTSFLLEIQKQYSEAKEVR
ncbi:MAG: hypothetical protein QY332_14905 [Anaerolineales bacterium]|nr:MAG: hypothetical protein QY332_14905 [Anaerolineales bacterium]